MMKPYLQVLFGGLILLSLVCAASSDPTEAASVTVDETPVKKVETVSPQTFINVPKPLRKLFPVLQEIEQRITLGHQAGDPSALLDAIRDLNRAELFTGALGSTGNSDQLLIEATELAYQQRDTQALQESLALWASPSRAGKNSDKIQQTTERLEEVKKENDAMTNKKRCRIIFHNRTDRPLTVTVNRRPLGMLAPGGKQEVTDLLAGRQYLAASDESLQWGPRKVYVGPGEIFNWRLFD